MTTTQNHTETILVTAGTGKVGRRVAERLAAKGFPVRIGSRSAEIPFDWEDRSTWASVLQGVHGVFLMYTPDIGDPRAGDTIRAFSELAVANGVQRLVLLSARGEDQAAPAEQAVRESGAEWTVLQAAWFNQNFDEGVFTDHSAGFADSAHLTRVCRSMFGAPPSEFRGIRWVAELPVGWTAGLFKPPDAPVGESGS
ncbi:NAD(P)H-binding protein [Nocardia sp. NBC_01009]|uniref:NAD(P)H-binding protein n=1 Tax=Nocardia sp. NBC_01009 TaxID=2975996 RepID=UPI00386AF2C1|nr:NAD(P)H-binding protein [Nocardia sp. NBC_01009]